VYFGCQVYSGLHRQRGSDGQQLKMSTRPRKEVNSRGGLQGNIPQGADASSKGSGRRGTR